MDLSHIYLAVLFWSLVPVLARLKILPIKFTGAFYGQILLSVGLGNRVR